MVTIECEVSKVEEKLKELEDSYSNVNIYNKEIKSNISSEEYFSDFDKVADHIKTVAEQIEQNSGKIALDDPEMISFMERMELIAKTAKKIKLIFSNFSNSRNSQLESITKVVNSLSYLIGVVHDTLNIIKLNESIEKMRDSEVSEEEEEFLEDILEEVEKISNYRN